VKEAATISLVAANGEGTESFPSDELVIVVHELPEMMVSNLVEPACAGFDNGSITVAATGGLSPYQFSWQGYAEVSATLSGIPAGEYGVVVTDQNGCSEFMMIGLNEPEPLTVEEIVELVYCPDFSDGSVELVISGGTEPYSISWDGGGTGTYLADLTPGTYSYEVRDGNDCLATGTVEVGYENEVCFTIPGIITPNDDGYNDTWKLDGIEVYPDATIEIFDRWGKRVFYSEGYDQQFDGTWNDRELPMESYHYVIDLHNGTERVVGNITIIR
jgi:gliding motility-associated-like protein